MGFVQTLLNYMTWTKTRCYIKNMKNFVDKAIKAEHRLGVNINFVYWVNNRMLLC